MVIPIRTDLWWVFGKIYLELKPLIWSTYRRKLKTWNWMMLVKIQFLDSFKILVEESKLPPRKNTVWSPLWAFNQTYNFICSFSELWRVYGPAWHSSKKGQWNDLGGGKFDFNSSNWAFKSEYFNIKSLSVEIDYNKQ